MKTQGFAAVLVISTWGILTWANTPKVPDVLRCELIIQKASDAVGGTMAQDQDPSQFIEAAGQVLGDKLIDAVYNADQGLSAQALEVMAQDAMAALGSVNASDDKRFEVTIRELSARGQVMKSMMANLADLHTKLGSIEVQSDPRGVLGRAGSLVRRGMARVPVLGTQVEKIVVSSTNVGDVFNELRQAIIQKSEEVRGALHANQDDIFKWHEEAAYHRLQAAGFDAMAKKVEHEISALEREGAQANASQIAAFKIFLRNIRDQQEAAQGAEEMKLNAIERALIVGDVLLAARGDLQTKAPVMLQRIQMNVATGQIMQVATNAESFTGELAKTAARTEIDLAKEMEGTVKRLIALRDGQDWNKMIAEAQKAQEITRKLLAEDVGKRDARRSQVLAQNQLRIEVLRSKVDPEVFARSKTNPSIADSSEALEAKPALESPTSVGFGGRRRQRLTSRTQEPTEMPVVTPPPLALPQQEPKPVKPRKPRPKKSE